MGWLAKMGPLLVVLLLATCTFTAADSLTSSSCDDPSKNPMININADGQFSVLYVPNLSSNIAGSCTWNISSPIATSVLELTSVVLDKEDSLVVIGNSSDGKTTTTLFNSTGTPPSGLISIGPDDFKNVIVQLKVSAKASFERSFSTVYYLGTPIHLQKDSGELTFLLNANKRSNITFELRPGTQYSDGILMFNITQVPKTAIVTIDGQPISSTTTVLLQDPNKPTVSVQVKNYVSGEQVQARYWVVNRGCSGKFDLKLGDAKPILYPNAEARKQRLQTAVRCGQYFAAPKDAQFQVLIQPNATGLQDSSDALNFYDSTGALVLGLNYYALMYFRTIENVIGSSSVIVFYDSPYVSSPNPTFQTPQIKAIPSTQSSMIMLVDKDVPVSVTLDGKNSVTHLVYSADHTVSNILVLFPNITLKPGDISISVFNSETATGNPTPIATLGQFDRLPSAIAGNSYILRVVYSGTLKSPLNVVYRGVKSSESSCQHVSTFTPNFEVYGNSLSGRCSWYIPESKSGNFTVLNPTIVKIPTGKSLTMTIFSKDGSKTKTISGPVAQYYLPDFFLSPANAYEFTVDTTNTTKEDLHILLAQKSDYLNETLQIQASEKVPSVSSANYPGFYPVGMPTLTENWVFIGKPTESALITIEDVHLADKHTLMLVAQTLKSISITGDQSLVNIPDYLVPFPFSISLDSQASDLNNLTHLSNRGFKVNLQYPGVAAIVDASKGTTIQFNASSAVEGKPLSIWQVIANPQEKTNSDTILHINVSLTESLDKTKATLAVYDSISLRPGSVHNANGSLTGTSGHYLGSIRSAFIVYDYSAATPLSKKGADFSVTFTITPEKCTNKNYTTKKCATTDRCITDLMVCNGIDECGDYTDELHCNGTAPAPIPPAPAPSSGGGVNTLVVIFILMPMSAILGIVGYIYLPQFLMRIRRGRYSEFRDLSEVS